MTETDPLTVLEGRGQNQAVSTAMLSLEAQGQTSFLDPWSRHSHLCLCLHVAFPCVGLGQNGLFSLSCRIRGIALRATWIIQDKLLLSRIII